MAREQLIAWLNDAYAMEQGLIPVLENHAKDADKDMPQAASRMRQHVEETRRHAERVEQCLRELGTSPSTIKSTLSSIMGSVQSVTTGIFQDEPVKNVLSDFGAEEFEVACYRALSTAATEMGEPTVARLCEENMREDQQMASWLDQQLPTVVKHAMNKKAAGASH